MHCTSRQVSASWHCQTEAIAGLCRAYKALAALAVQGQNTAPAQGASLYSLKSALLHDVATALAKRGSQGGTETLVQLPPLAETAPWEVEANA